MDEDGLITGGIPGAQLTWMDAKIGDWVVTPRHGKPVEIQALWVHALLSDKPSPACSARHLTPINARLIGNEP